MLLALSIKNYALIEYLTIDFTGGFTVITGETGSGKSILIKSIELLTGARADLSSIRSGCSACDITASFEYSNSKVDDFLDNFSISAGNNIVLIRRTIENTGKSKAFINDSHVSILALATLGKLLIDFHGQDEKHSLLDLDAQLEILDNEIEDIRPLLKESAALYAQIKNLRSKLEALNLSDAERGRKNDLYSFQVREIEDAELETGEDKKLELDIPKLKNAEKISALSQEIISALYSSENSILGNILKTKKNIEAINSYGADASGAVSLIEQAYYQTEEAYREVDIILSKTRLDPEKLNASLERVELIKKLKKKYGSSIESVIEYKNKIAGELNSLNNCKDNFEKLKKELKSETKRLSELCETISKKRQEAAQVFAKSVREKLFDLEIKNAVFEVKFDRKELSADGYDLVEFMFCANKGEKTIPLKNSASGGELSRTLLALKLSSKIKTDRVVIFDEIDSGTGGKTGGNIGKKLSELARRKQVFSVTHLAQIAAFAGTHIKIYKETENSRTYTKAKVLTETEHIEEIARMISGEKITKAALEHAKDLVAASVKS
ncbi:DNA repair protein RecN [Candidatus Endomicrobiellum trichonymphae]|uniref:DNA repair protein RecN n=1 Tax=Endomicrobium trichonymphae TaxID=1408204 RepID=B1H0G7_ENDTX|nr:DNA repair protein RecN [Candidatus Endomicrobium trichonymphae]BAG13999.1 DNA repair protein RecN [Candidatus Endomicrobium trichonymphae]